MVSLGPLSFAAPWVLALLLTLPALWWLLRVTPPAPRRIAFPAIRLLRGLRAEEHVTAHTPWWLLLLRLLIAALVILGLARPLFNAVAGPDPDMPLVLVIDDGWASAADWSARMAAADTLLSRADRAERPVILLTTARLPDDAPPPQLEPRAAAAVRSTVQALSPKPWPTDRAAASRRLADSGLTPPAVVAWIQDGLGDGPGDVSGTAALTSTLTGLGRLTVLTGPQIAGGPLLLDPPSQTAEGLSVMLRRPAANGLGDPAPAAEVRVRLHDTDGRVVARTPVSFDAGAASATAVLSPPGEGTGSVPLSRLDLSTDGSQALAGAGAVVLLDDGWRRKPVGLITDGDNGAGVPLLDPLHYVRKALAPRAELHEGSLSALLDQDMALLVLPGITPLLADQEQALDSWVRGGGTLIRFAGPRPDNRTDGLLPVRLRGGDRRLGGAMSWNKPAALADFPLTGPFAGLPVRDDVTVTSQVLAEPSPDLAERTWARLDDGTPLVTAAARGEGRVILFHVTPDPRWSSLPMSLLFVRMLDRMVDLASGVPGAETEGRRPLPPLRVLDGFGRLGPAGPAVEPLPPLTAGGAVDGGGAPGRVGPTHPPGLYGTDAAAQALNLAESVPSLTPAPPWPSSVQARAFADLDREKDLSPWFLLAALILALIDVAVGMALRGLLPRPGAAGRGASLSRTAGLGLLLAAGLGMTALMPATQARAQALSDTPPPDLDLVREAALDPRLAYVLTGDQGVDEVTEAGLITLTEVLARRTAAELAPPKGLDLVVDDPLVFPMLYWPVTPGQMPPPPAAIVRLNAYLHHGGLIVFDTRDGGDLRSVAGGLDIPPLQPAPEDHVLTRSFYLLGDFPGRITGQTTWVASEGGDNDGVSPVVIGGNDWAGAWARDAAGNALHAVSPGGERQRELAYRFGINLVMYALTGNYKGDQVHLPAIMERLTN